MKKLIFSGALLLAAAPVLAQAPDASSETNSGGGAAPAGAGSDQVICRSVADIGSRLSRTRVCMTRTQWEERRRETRANVSRSQGNSRNDGN